jgi:hypothetical protein
MNMTQLIYKSPDPSQGLPLIKEALANERKLLLSGIQTLEKDLSAWEEKYKKSSADFFAQYQQGELGDSLDFVDWAGQYQLLQDLKKHLSKIEEIEVC